MVELLREINARIEPLLGENGRIVKRLGDGLMVVFDDAQAATLAAIRCRDLTADLTAELTTKLSAQDTGTRQGLQLCVGLHTGHPIPLGGDYFGQDVNTAARLAQHAGPGQILISNTTREQLPTSWRLRRVPMRAKGVPPHIHAYQVTATRPAPTHHPPLEILDPQTG
jgi:adenylate cyclase